MEGGTEGVSFQRVIGSGMGQNVARILKRQRLSCRRCGHKTGFWKKSTKTVEVAWMVAGGEEDGGEGLGITGDSGKRKSVARSSSPPFIRPAKTAAACSRT
nr:hypothetical protein Iba_chr01dCG6040 [Ipomoea batatas]